MASAIRENLAELIDREIKDPRVRAAGLVSINTVDLNTDMSIARVYTSFFGGDEAASAEAIRGLNAASGFLRGPLGRRMNLARTPELRFMLDTSPEFNQRLANIVADDDARAAARRDDDTTDDDD